MMTTYAQKFTWVSFSNLLLWDSAEAKICKFDFRNRGLMMKPAGQTSLPIRPIEKQVNKKIPLQS